MFTRSDHGLDKWDTSLRVNILKILSELGTKLNHSFEPLWRRATYDLYRDDPNGAGIDRKAPNAWRMLLYTTLKGFGVFSDHDLDPAEKCEGE